MTCVFLIIIAKTTEIIDTSAYLILIIIIIITIKIISLIKTRLID
jgi:hypothetical protein